MKNTSYYESPVLERFILETERRLKITFYTCLIGSSICLPCIWYILWTDTNLKSFDYTFLLVCSIAILVCLIGIGYCYYSARQNRAEYESLLQNQQEERENLLAELNK